VRKKKNTGLFKWSVICFTVVFSFFLADYLMGETAQPERQPGVIPFDHSIHRDSAGMDCAACHTGARSLAHAYMPSKADCMDCHRLPLTENAGIEVLDSLLAAAPDRPWSQKKRLPDHVVFHHGVHAAAGVTCDDCHSSGYVHNRYGGERFDMQTCIKCHRGESFKDRGFKSAATYCAACHR